MSEEKLRVLVVEDEPLLLDAIVKKLNIAGLTPLPFEDGQKALDQLITMDPLPDAIWLDYYLKDMNGLLFMNSLKSNPSWEHIPVIVVSNSATANTVQSMLALGAKQYVVKAEHRLEEIIEVIKDLANENKTA
jgi:CheY-like chemotaxis protein